jgi:hypothetical protein
VDFGKLLYYVFILLFYFLLGLLSYFLHPNGISMGVLILYFYYFILIFWYRLDIIIYYFLKDMDNRPIKGNSSGKYTFVLDPTNDIAAYNNGSA